MLSVVCPFKGPVSNCGDQATKPYGTGACQVLPLRKGGGGGGGF